MLHLRGVEGSESDAVGLVGYLLLRGHKLHCRFEPRRLTGARLRHYRSPEHTRFLPPRKFLDHPGVTDRPRHRGEQRQGHHRLVAADPPGRFLDERGERFGELLRGERLPLDHHVILVRLRRHRGPGLRLGHQRLERLPQIDGIDGVVSLDPIVSVTALGEPGPEVDQPHHLHRLRPGPESEISDSDSVALTGLVSIWNDHHGPALHRAPVSLGGALGTVGARGGGDAQRDESFGSLASLRHEDRPVSGEHLGEPIDRPRRRQAERPRPAGRGHDLAEGFAVIALGESQLTENVPAVGIVVVVSPHRLPAHDPLPASHRRLRRREGWLRLAGRPARRSTWG